MNPSNLQLHWNQHSVDDFYSHYSLEETLGNGMSSVVYKCSSRSNKGSKFAVKIVDLLKGDLSESALREEVMREIEILENVSNHSNITSIVTYMETIANIFIVMDLCEEGDLYDFMNERVTLKAPQTIIIMKQLVCAIRYIHSEFIVHRDVKLENILLTNRKELSIKLADFGLAVRVTTDTEITEIVGTPTYYAPELILTAKGQANGYGREVDVWACGVVMYTLMIGHAPFQHRRQIVMLRLITNGNYDREDDMWKSLKPKLKCLIERIFVVDPKVRLTSKELEKEIIDAGLGKKFSYKRSKKQRSFSSLRVVAIVVLACIRISRMSLTINSEKAKEDPFSCRQGREIIISMAMEIYGHWIKRDQFNQVLALDSCQYGNHSSLIKSKLICDAQDNSHVSISISSATENR